MSKIFSFFLLIWKHFKFEIYYILSNIFPYILQILYKYIFIINNYTAIFSIKIKIFKKKKYIQIHEKINFQESVLYTLYSLTTLIYSYK